jgi:hypothetical protein
VIVRAPGRTVLAEPPITVKVSTARPFIQGVFRMPLFMYRCPIARYPVQGFVAEDTSEDCHVYEPVTCPVCHRIHHVNPHTGVVLGEKVNTAASVAAGSSSSTITVR